jgi:hypothetical protein
MQQTITLYRTPDGWMARHSDPTVKELFGTDTLPTAFTAAASAETVIAEISRLNQGCRLIVSLAEIEDQTSAH